MIRPLSNEVLAAIDSALTSHGFTWIELIHHCMPVQDAPVTGNGNGNGTCKDEGRPSEEVRAKIELIMKSRLSSNAERFIAETLIRTSKYPSVRFSPKQQEWFDSLYQKAQNNG